MARIGSRSPSCNEVCPVLISKKFRCRFWCPKLALFFIEFWGKRGGHSYLQIFVSHEKMQHSFPKRGEGGGGRFIQIQGSDRPSAPSIYGQCFITADSRCYQTNSVAFFTGSICFIFITRSLGDLPGPDF